MKMMRNNKKGLGFILLLSVFIVIIVLFASMRILTPLEDLEEKGQQVNDLILETDGVLIESNLASYYLETQVEKYLYEFKKNYASLASNKINSNVDSKCRNSDKDLNLWHNERDLRSLDVKIEGEEVVEDETLEPQEDREFVNCYPVSEDSKIEQEIVSELKTFLEGKLRTDFKDVSEISQIEVSTKVVSSSLFQVEVKAKFSKSTKTGGIKKDIRISEKLEFGPYGVVISSSRNILSKYSNLARTMVPKCLDTATEVKDDLESHCFKQVYSALLTQEVDSLDDSRIKNYYDIKVDNVGFHEGDENSYYLSFKFINKKNEQEEISFGGLFDYNLPLGQVNFNVNTHPSIDNTLKVDFEKPRGGSGASMFFLIFYSYEDFFSNSYGAKGKFMEMLQNSQIPQDSKMMGFSSHGDPIYIVSDTQNSDLEKINIISVDDDKLLFDESTEKYKGSLFLYEIWNPQKKEFELLEQNKDVYVYVFGIQGNKDYFLDGIGENKLAKSAKPMAKFVPMPLTLDDPQLLKFAQEVEEVHSSFTFRVEGYGDDFAKLEVGDNAFADFYSYDIYIFNNRGKQKVGYQCQGFSSSDCYYISGRDAIGEVQGDISIAVTSVSSQVLPDDKFVYNGNKVEKVLRINNFELKNGEKYEVLVVPVNSQGYGVLESSVQDGQYQKVDTTYDFVSVNKIIKLPFKEVEIVDNSPPNPMTSIQVLGINNDGTNFYLSWKPLDERITSISVNYEAYVIGQNGLELKSGASTHITPIGSNKIMDYSSDIVGVKVSRILPTVNGKSVDDLEGGYSGEFLSMTWGQVP